jgi:hypothetical protein
MEEMIIIGIIAYAGAWATFSVICVVYCQFGVSLFVSI